MPARKENVKDKAEKTVSKAAQKAHTAIEKGKPADDVVRRAADAAHDGVDRAADYAAHAADALTEKGYKIKQKEEEWVGRINKYVQDNPVTSLGIAVAGGFLLSRILSNR